jgi:hypothetical protein
MPYSPKLRRIWMVESRHSRSSGRNMTESEWVLPLIAKPTALQRYVYSIHLYHSSCSSSAQRSPCKRSVRRSREQNGSCFSDTSSRANRGQRAAGVQRAASGDGIRPADGGVTPRLKGGSARSWRRCLSALTSGVSGKSKRSAKSRRRNECARPTVGAKYANSRSFAALRVTVAALRMATSAASATATERA